MNNWKSTTQGLTPLDCPYVHITNSTLCCWLQLSQGGLIYDFKLFWKYNTCTLPLCHWHCIKIVVLVFWADNGDRRTKHQRRQHQRNYWRWGGRSSNHSGIFHFQGYCFVTGPDIYCFASLQMFCKYQSLFVMSQAHQRGQSADIGLHLIIAHCLLV